MLFSWLNVNEIKATNMQQLRSDPTLSDCTIKYHDKIHHLSKFFLSWRSRYFYSSFNTFQTDEIDLSNTDFNSNVLDAIIEFIHFTFDLDCIFIWLLKGLPINQLYEASKYFQIDELETLILKAFDLFPTSTVFTNSIKNHPKNILNNLLNGINNDSNNSMNGINNDSNNSMNGIKDNSMNINSNYMNGIQSNYDIKNNSMNGIKSRNIDIDTIVNIFKSLDELIFQPDIQIKFQWIFVMIQIQEMKSLQSILNQFPLSNFEILFQFLFIQLNEQERFQIFLNSFQQKSKQDQMILRSRYLEEFNFSMIDPNISFQLCQSIPDCKQVAISMYQKQRLYDSRMYIGCKTFCFKSSKTECEFEFMISDYKFQIKLKDEFDCLGYKSVFLYTDWKLIRQQQEFLEFGFYIYEFNEMIGRQEFNEESLEYLEFFSQERMKEDGYGNVMVSLQDFQEGQEYILAIRMHLLPYD
ncbi:hypothetical protein BC833DRAFT_583595 [Globomyces pollinis-pini]|nr:hypothetical protein BC833DRAFT_583595 [Globomyces pollinis-pini]